MRTQTAHVHHSRQTSRVPLAMGGLTLALLMAFTAPTLADGPPSLHVQHRMHSRAERDPLTVRLTWLYVYVERLLGCGPARPFRAHAVAHVVPVRRLKPARPDPGSIIPSPFVTTISPAPSPIATGGLNRWPPAETFGAPAPDDVITAAVRSQLKTDLVKLEFASRTYDETKKAGETVFSTRADWTVLERSRDALSDAELASAKSSGFEANAYVDEATRTIVVAVAGSQDWRRDFIAADVWKAFVFAQAPQHFYMAKTYVRSVIERFGPLGYDIECVGHSLGGGACAYAAAELGIRALVLNPISAGKLAPAGHTLVRNYVVDGEIASLVYRARGNEFDGEVQVINDGRDVIRLMALEKYGQLAGPILVVRELRAGIENHRVGHALDLMAQQAETARPR